MARGKKVEQVLTLEEKLEQALVPEDEQPYSIPENWCWCKIAFISNFERGITFPASAKEHEATKTNIPCLRTTNIQDELKIEDLLYIDKSYMKNNEEKYVRSDDIIMSSANSKELVGNVSYVYGIPFPMTFGGFILIIRAKKINSRYLFYYLRLNFLCGKFMGESTQTTNIANINTTKLKNLGLPLPPITEQQRIVDRIECLFSKLDEAKEKVQAVVDGFELRKSAILHKAFTGELTVQWRKTNEVELESWESVQWGDLITSIKAGKNWLAEGHPPNNDEFGVVKVSAVTWGEFDERESKTCTTPSQWNEAVQIKTGDFLFSRANTLQLVGNCVIVEDISKRLMLSDKILKLTFSEKIIPWFVLYFTNSKLYRVQIEDLSSGNQDGMRNVSQKNLKLVELLLPRLQEQKEIVRILDNFFAKEKQAKQAAESVLTQIDYIKKSILSRAFRGELETNDPAEESAEELLKTVL